MSTSDQFNIRWNNYTSVLQNVFRKLLEGEQFVDVSLACEGQSIKCHRLILSACSTYFDRILTDNPTPNLVIYLKDMKFWELRALVTFMYNGEVSISQQKLPYLCKAAEALKIKGLANDSGIVDGDLDELMDDEDEVDEVEDLRPQNPSRSASSLLSGPPKSLLRQQHHTNLSAFAAAAAAANRQHQQQPQSLPTQQVKRKIATQPPKLVKMQRMERTPISGNGNAKPSIPVSGGLTKNIVVRKTEQDAGKTSPPVKKEEEVDQDSNDEDVDSSIKAEEVANGDHEENNDVDGDEHESQGSDGDEPPEGNVSKPSSHNKVQMKYGKEIRDSALTALQSGMTVKQCSETYGVPRKTISKWKSREAIAAAKHDGDEGEASPARAQSGKPEPPTPILQGNGGTPIILPPKTAMGAPVDSADRAERLKKATELALSGVTVRQAAAHYEIPRTTLCAYMKRRGLAAKRNFSPTNKRGGAKPERNGDANGNGQVQSGGSSSLYEDFPFLGISEMMDEMNQGGYDADAYNDADEECLEKQ